MKRILAFICLIGCSGTGITTEAEEPITEPIDSGEMQINICNKIPYETACKDVTCGNAKDGCGSYYICVAEPAWACGCKEDNLPVCKPGNVSYWCPPNIIPTFCYKVVNPANYWCCSGAI